MHLEILRKAGLSDGEIKVYSAVLDIGIAPINKIHEKTGIERRNIYDILNKLIERGLVAYIEENGKRTFKLSNPDKIISYIEEKRVYLDTVKKEVTKLMPEIQRLFKSKKEGVFAEIFKGAEGIKAVWDDMLNYPAAYWIGSGFYVPDRFPAFFDDWNVRRMERKIRSYHLFRYEKRKDPSLKRLKRLTSWKFLPIEFSGSPTVTVVFGNKVAQFLYGNALFAFVIESKELAENYRAYHQYLWKHVAKP